MQSVLRKTLRTLKSTPQSKQVAARSRLLRKRRLLDRVIALLPSLSATLVLVGYLYLLAIPWSGLARRTYMSENAIQPAQVNTYWSWGEVHACDRFAEDLVLWDTLDVQTRADHLRDVFVKHGLRAEDQTYSFRFVNDTVSGINVYAVLRAAKTAGAESIVLSASWRSREHDRLNVRGVATLLTMSKYLSKLSVWSKDIIFVISDGYIDGMQAWITAWHGDKQSNLIAAPLSQKSGPIWAALNIDYPHHSFSHLGLFYEAANGLLPNLDFLNTVAHISRWAGGSPIQLHTDGQDLRDDQWQGGFLDSVLVKEYERAAKNIWSQMKRQAFGSAGGPEGLFAKYRIDALTLFAVPADGPHGFYSVGKTVESTLRSINNLLERFHQSFFLYLLSSPDTFISLANYLAAPLLVSVGLTLRGLYVWAKLCARDTARPMGSAWTFVAVLHTQGVMLFYIWTQLPPHLVTQPGSLTAFALSMPSTAWLLSRFAWRDLAQLLHCLNLLLGGVALAVVSVLNFSLGVLAAVCLGLPLLLARRLPSLLALALAICLMPAPLAMATGTSTADLLREWQMLGTWFLPFTMVVMTPLLAQSMLVARL